MRNLSVSLLSSATTSFRFLVKGSGSRYMFSSLKKLVIVLVVHGQDVMSGTSKGPIRNCND